MSWAAKEGRDVRITEKSEKARREFFQKCEKLKREGGHSEKLILDIANKAALEYTKVFGRLGMHPLLHLKGGKKRPRYLVDRDETWVIYKPALWQMGGSDAGWRRNVQAKFQTCKSLEQAKESYTSSEKAESLQEWHGLLMGLLWIPPEHEHNVMKGWGFIQRLDVETDGPVMVAKTWRAQRSLQIQMKMHVNTKAYLCLVHGRLENKVAHIKRSFAELGSDQNTQVMLQHDQVNDPFFDWSAHGKWKKRSVRKAETFYKPIAYYHRKEDNTDYTLCYVNILTGITHQIRITMQSVGHPLVADDRYLPREQALADLKWCPRNFLVEVRADFFDVCGPFEDEARRKYARVSIENPLPKMFQNVLTQKLALVEQLDETADLFVGPQYWAIGDKELMSAHVKDNEYRMKVMRWGARRGIHLDALDRLLLLSKEEIDDVLTSYKPPSELGYQRLEPWVCPKCMHWNTAADSLRFDRDPDVCKGGSAIGAIQECDGTRLVKEDTKLPEGWLNYAKDPTIHLLYSINHRWLDARRAILKQARPSWEKPPVEKEGTSCSPALAAVVTAALEGKTKQGELGINENDLRKLPGLEDIVLPLGDLPADGMLHRVRLPGRGTDGQWTYTLKASHKVQWTMEVDKKPQRIPRPLYVKTDTLPPKQVRDSNEEDLEEQQPKGDEGLKALQRGLGHKELPALAEQVETDLPAAKRARAVRKWSKKESKSNPGSFYFLDTTTGETSVDVPEGFVDETAGSNGKSTTSGAAKGSREPKWERKVSNSSGKPYYYNVETGESRVDRPPATDIIGANEGAAEEEPRWERRESSSKPGSFYYFNSKTGENEVTPPVVDLPWARVESKTKRGQFFYYNEVTNTTVVDPPLGARKATSRNGATANAVSRTSAGPMAAAGRTERLPAAWTKKESDKYKGKFYYVNAKTGENSWTKPSPWEKSESSSHPGKFYYKNVETGETSWEKQVVDIPK